MKTLDEKLIHSAYIDGDGSLYLYDKDENSLDGWPENWPEYIEKARAFLAAKNIIVYPWATWIFTNYLPTNS